MKFKQKEGGKKQEAIRNMQLAINNTPMRITRPPFSSRVYYFLFFVFSSCSVSKQIARSAHEDVLSSKPLQAAHVGLSIYDPASNKYLYNYQGDKYFVPASNTKIPTCYAAMKYLGDSLVGLRYTDNGANTIIQGTGDPSFLHPDYKRQPVLEFLLRQVDPIWYNEIPGPVSHFGSGWAWNDFAEKYMTERSFMPIYGNIVKFAKGNVNNSSADSLPHFSIEAVPGFFKKNIVIGNVGWKNATGFSIDRTISENSFIVIPSGNSSVSEIPFANARVITTHLLADTLHKMVIYMGTTKKKFANIIHSQPTDSLLKPMMHRSDNFFAEQALLMVSNEMLGVMNDAKIIDTILKTDFKDLPQKPRWADGSGLSRYNLFTPQDFVAILNKMKNEFGMDRIKTIFATGGEGTISSYYKADSGYIYGKTGTLSGVVAFSGFMYTKKGKLLIFSTLINNHQASATDVRRAIEKFLQGVRNRY